MPTPKPIPLHQDNKSDFLCLIHIEETYDFTRRSATSQITNYEWQWPNVCGGIQTHNTGRTREISQESTKKINFKFSKAPFVL